MSASVDAPPTTPKSLPPLDAHASRSSSDQPKQATNLLSKCAIRTTPEYPGTTIPELSIGANETFQYTEVKKIIHSHNGEDVIVEFYRLADGRGWIHDFCELDPGNTRSIQKVVPSEPSSPKPRELGSEGKMHMMSPEAARDVLELQKEKGLLQTKLDSQTKELERTKQMYQMLVGEYMTLQKKHKQLHKNTTTLLWEHLKSCDDPSVSHIPTVDKRISETAGQIGSLTLQKKIGEGEFAKVYDCSEGEGEAGAQGEKRCAKVIVKEKITNLSSLKRVNNEIRALRRITDGGKCRGSLDLHEVIQTQSHLCLVMDMGSRDLFEYLNEFESGLLDALSRDVARGIAEAVHDIHAVGVAHRDLKPENILVSAQSDSSSAFFNSCAVRDVHLCDFGLCAVEGGAATSAAAADASGPGGVEMGVGAAAAPQTYYTDFCGSPGFFAPEMVITRKHMPYAADVWSMGCVFLEIVLGHRQFYEMWVTAYDTRLMHDPEKFAKRIAAALIQVEARLDELAQGSGAEPALPGEAKDLILRMLKIVPGARPTAAEVLCHPWLKPPPVPIASVAPVPIASAAILETTVEVLPGVPSEQASKLEPQQAAAAAASKAGAALESESESESESAGAGAEATET